jgi:hypothetical protein
MVRIFTREDLNNIEKERQKKGIKTVEDIRRQYPSCRVEKTERGYFVTQSRGYLILDKNGKMVDGVYADESWD